MRRGLLLALGATAVSAFLLPAGASAGTLDQQQLLATAPGPQVINAGATPGSVAQTFTPGMTGRLDQVDLDLTFIAGQPTQPLIVEIRNVAGGTPGNNVLASSSVPTPAPGPVTFVPVTFAAPASVTAGVQYAIVTSSATPDTNRWGWWGVINSSPYSGGEYFNATSSPPTTTWNPWPGMGADQAFKTYVAPPLPPVTTPGPTGQRAAALKKCAKKHSKKKRKKCRKLAGKLPV
jgi:hypothetical protein